MNISNSQGAFVVQGIRAVVSMLIAPWWRRR